MVVRSAAEFVWVIALSQEMTKGEVASWSPRKWTRRSSAASAVLTKVVDAIKFRY